MSYSKIIADLASGGGAAQIPEVLSALKAEQEHKAFVAWQNALLECQKEVAYVSKDANNNQTHSKYATLQKLDAILRPHYNANGFTVTFGTKPADRENVITVTCMLSHEKGYEREFEADIPCDGLGAKGNKVMTTTHAVGSAMTYGRRYLLCMVFNIMTGNEPDDDGNAAGRKVAPKKAAPISDEQLSEIITLCNETATEQSKFCEYLSKKFKAKIGSISEIPEDAFKFAVGMLNKKAEKMDAQA